jgi:acetolactate synthase small subunit
MSIELTASGSKLDAFIQAIDAGLILETVRTGVSGIGRGEAHSESLNQTDHFFTQEDIA